jgi:hypothetical protein
MWCVHADSRLFVQWDMSEKDCADDVVLHWLGSGNDSIDESVPFMQLLTSPVYPGSSSWGQLGGGGNASPHQAPCGASGINVPIDSTKGFFESHDSSFCQIPGVANIMVSSNAGDHCSSSPCTSSVCCSVVMLSSTRMPCRNTQFQKRDAHLSNSASFTPLSVQEVP